MFSDDAVTIIPKTIIDVNKKNTDAKVFQKLISITINRRINFNNFF